MEIILYYVIGVYIALVCTRVINNHLSPSELYPLPEELCIFSLFLVAIYLFALAVIIINRSAKYTANAISNILNNYE